MRRRRRLLAIVCAASLACGVAFAATETVVPIAGLERIDATLARRLGGIFDRYPGLESARVWRGVDSTLSLEVIERRGAALVREWTPLRDAAFDSLQSAVSRALASAPLAAPVPVEPSGRPLLLAGMTIVGLGLYSWATPVALELEGESALGAGLVTAIGAGFAIPYFVSQRIPVTYGMANLSLYGATRGAFHGILFVEAIEGAGDKDVSGKALAGGAAVGSFVEAAGGFVYGLKSHASPGAARVISLGGDTGTFFGLGFAELFDGSNENFFDLEKKTSLDVAGLAGAAIGFVSGAVTAKHWSVTWGDGEIVRMGGLVGASWGIATANQDDNESVLGLAMLGDAIGLVASRKLVAGYDFTPGQAVLVDTGSFAGALLGLGIAALSSENSGQGYWIASAAGATVGFALTLHGTGRRAGRHPDDFGMFHLDLDPAGLVRWACDRGDPRAHRGTDSLARSFVTARLQF